MVGLTPVSPLEDLIALALQLLLYASHNISSSWDLAGMRALVKWSFIAVTKNTFTSNGLKQYDIQRTHEDRKAGPPSVPEYTDGAMC